MSRHARGPDISWPNESRPVLAKGEGSYIQGVQKIDTFFVCLITLS